jgi:hypothetical protein
MSSREQRARALILKDFDLAEAIFGEENVCNDTDRIRQINLVPSGFLTTLVRSALTEAIQGCVQHGYREWDRERATWDHKGEARKRAAANWWAWAGKTYGELLSLEGDNRYGPDPKAPPSEYCSWQCYDDAGDIGTVADQQSCAGCKAC